MFKTIKNSYQQWREKCVKELKEQRDERIKDEEYRKERSVIVPPELLQKLIDANPEYMKDRLVPLYWHTGEFWFNEIHTGNSKRNLERYIKGIIYQNLKSGIPYDKIISELSDPNRKINPEERQDEVQSAH